MRSKGVTPVVATVLLITISVAATGTAYTFIVSAQDQATQHYQEDLTQREIRQNTDFDIENVQNQGGDAVLFIRNTGEIPVILDNEADEKIVNLYIEDEISNWDYVGGDPSPGSITRLAAGETFQIDSNEPFPASETEFKLVGRYGTEAYYTCNPGVAC